MEEGRDLTPPHIPQHIFHESVRSAKSVDSMDGLTQPIEILKDILSNESMTPFGGVRLTATLARYLQNVSIWIPGALEGDAYYRIGRH